MLTLKFIKKNNQILQLCHTNLMRKLYFEVKNRKSEISRVKDSNAFCTR